MHWVSLLFLSNFAIAVYVVVGFICIMPPIMWVLDKLEGDGYMYDEYVPFADHYPKPAPSGFSQMQQQQRDEWKNLALRSMSLPPGGGGLPPQYADLMTKDEKRMGLIYTQLDSEFERMKFIPSAEHIRQRMDELTGRNSTTMSRCRYCGVKSNTTTGHCVECGAPV